jgi:hypothetical protein
LLFQVLAHAEHAPRAARGVNHRLDPQRYLAAPTIRLYDVACSFEGSGLEHGLKEAVADCLALARIDAAQ